MINFTDALKKAEKFRGNKICSASDCGDRWIFGFEEDVGKTGSAPVAVFKEKGTCEYFFVVDYILEGVFDRIKKIDLDSYVKKEREI